MHTRVVRLIALFLSLAVSGIGISQSGAVAQNNTSMTTLTGDSLAGTIRKIDAEGNVTGDGFESVKLAELLTVKRPLKETKPTIKYVVRLAGGGQIHATEAKVADGNVNVKTNIGDMTIPVGSIRAILYKPFNLADAVKGAIKFPSRSEDKVVVEASNRIQVVTGLVEEINDEKVKFNYKGQSRSIDRAKVVAVVMADLQEKRSAGSIASVKMSDTSNIVGTIHSLENGKLTVGLLGNAKSVLPFEQVVSITVRSDRLAYLSDLEATDTEYTSVVTPKREMTLDKSLDGNPLTLNWVSTKKSKTYDRGIALHSYSRVVFENDGYHQFSATCGIDAETGGNGHAKVIVRGDGIELWSGEISADTDPQVLEVDIDGYKEIAIVVENGKHLDMADHVDFANARFLKTK